SRSPPDGQFVVDPDAEQRVIAGLRQAESNGRLEGRARRGAPADGRGQIVPLLSALEPLCRTESAIELDRNHEVLGADTTGRRACQRSEVAGYADAVAEFEPLALGKVLLDDEVLGHVPGADGARHNELAFELVRVRLF